MEREGVAFEPQHSIPWVNRKLMFYLIEKRKRGDLNFKLLSEVHDALYLLVPDSEIGKLANAALSYSEWHPSIELPGGRLIIPVEVKNGKRLSEMQEYEI